MGDTVYMLGSRRGGWVDALEGVDRVRWGELVVTVSRERRGGWSGSLGGVAVIISWEGRGGWERPVLAPNLPQVAPRGIDSHIRI
jgi:hypothetical protein